MCKLEKIKKDELQLVPINSLDVSDDEKAALYQQLHVVTKGGQTLTGFDANMYAWRQTKGNNIFKIFGHVLAIPPMVWFGKLGYRFWLVVYRVRKARF